MKLSSWIFLFLVCVIAAGVLLPASPVYRPVPSTDPSVFLYVGQRILEGGVPYRDAWDHKQPLLYLLYALGQAITPGSFWGVWLLDLVAVAAAGWICFRILRRFTDHWLAFFSVAAGLLALYPILWGGAIEEFSLPFQAGCLLFLIFILNARDFRARILHGIGLGICIGLGFFLKQTMIAAGLAALLYLFLELVFRRRWRDILLFPAVLAGFMLVALPLLAYLALGGALPYYWDAAFIFNSRYAGLGPLELFKAALDALEFMSGMPGLYLVFAAWLICGGIAFVEAGSSLARAASKRWVYQGGLALGVAMIALSLAVELVGGDPGFGLFQIAAILGGAVLAIIGGLLANTRLRVGVVSWLESLPIVSAQDSASINYPLLLFLYFPTVLLMLSISGRNYVYYFIPFIPCLMLEFGVIGGTFLSVSKPGEGAFRRAAWIFLIGLLLGSAYMPALQLVNALSGKRNQPQPPEVAYIREHTQTDDTILVWGKPATYVYVVTGRKAPTRFFYQAPVWQENYNADHQVMTQTLMDVQNHPPLLFLFDSENTEKIGPGKTCPLPVSGTPNSPGQLFGYICGHYHFQGKVGEFLIFQLP